MKQHNHSTTGSLQSFSKRIYHLTADLLKFLIHLWPTGLRQITNMLQN